MTKAITFMCTAFRDGFQSVYGARVFTKDFLPALEAARDAGIGYFEAGGGARFQSLVARTILPALRGKFQYELQSIAQAFRGCKLALLGELARRTIPAQARRGS